jgi:pSer/pThr/pTyr-binding forkhead associated (FHA) protein
MALQVRLLERGATAEQTREVSVTKPEFLIGRAPDCDLRLRMSEVSRHHCIIRTTADEVTLVDLGSSNGTFLNGQRVRSQAALHSGDEIRLGDCHFLVDLGDRGSIELGLTNPDSLASTRKIPKDKGP